MKLQFLERLFNNSENYLFVKLYFQSKTIATTPLAQEALKNMARKALKVHKRATTGPIALPGDPNYGAEGWTDPKWNRLDNMDIFKGGTGNVSIEERKEKLMDYFQILRID